MAPRAHEGMTIISEDQDTIRRREAARQRGRFGEQHRHAPELTLPGATARLAEVEQRWAARQQAAQELERASVLRTIATMNDSVKGIQFTSHGGQLHAARILPTDPDTPVYVDEQFLLGLDVVSTYAENRSPSVELTPTPDAPGHWDWVPTAEQRATTADAAAEARDEALDRFREASYDLDAAAEEYLRNDLPDGVASVEVIFADAGGHPTPAAAYDAAGNLVAHTGPGWAVYTRVLAGVPDAIGRVGVPGRIMTGTTYRIERR